MLNEVFLYSVQKEYSNNLIDKNTVENTAIAELIIKILLTSFIIRLIWKSGAQSTSFQIKMCFNHFSKELLLILSKCTVPWPPVVGHRLCPLADEGLGIREGLSAWKQRGKKFTFMFDNFERWKVLFKTLRHKHTGLLQTVRVRQTDITWISERSVGWIKMEGGTMKTGHYKHIQIKTSLFSSMLAISNHTTNQTAKADYWKSEFLQDLKIHMRTNLTHSTS